MRRGKNSYSTENIPSLFDLFDETKESVEIVAVVEQEEMIETECRAEVKQNLAEQAVWYTELQQAKTEKTEHEEKLDRYYDRMRQIDDYFGRPRDFGVKGHTDPSERPMVARSITDLESMRDYMINNCAGLEQQIEDYYDDVDRADDGGYPRPHPQTVELQKYLFAGELQYSLSQLESRIGK